MRQEAVHHSIPCRQVIVDCLRKWMAGAGLNEQERYVVDQALIENRFELIREFFGQPENADGR
ncbi:hypothetical protein OIU34_02610 [Pararhizobium sp. BT-229]|uniref:hypothetical protein n=1 Tax=Pararhizobium sp. BT-229 TaxID=2986923 RepID=UPI0021F7A702|nr:hypothetical protein [Pararhizobium sp. BT-229]MCV9960780.1 hypothetical protein [Pararhizobium sp. BT-229]